MLKWKIKRSKESFINPIEVSAVNGEAEHEWLCIVNDLIKTAKSDANSQKIKIFTCHLYGYVGPKFDGEYIISNFRIAPAPIQNEMWGGTVHDSERIICVYLESTGETYDLARDAACSQANKIISLISIFLNFGFYEYYHYDLNSSLNFTHKLKPSYWAYVPKENGITFCKNVQLGYSFLPTMHDKYTSGKTRKLDRNEIEFVSYPPGETIKCPDDICELFSIVESLETNIKERFYAAAALMHFAILQYNNYPSVALSYDVAAIDVLTKTFSENRKLSLTNKIKTLITMCKQKITLEQKIIYLVKECYPNLDDKIISVLYKIVRCGHFHEGDFPVGEYKSNELFNPFSFLDNSDEARAIRGGHNLLRNVFIKWLLIH